MPSLLTSNTNECKWIQFIKPPSKCKPTWFWPNSRTWYGKPRIRPLARILETGSPIAVLLGWQPVVFHREVAHDSDSLAFWALGGSIPGGSIGIDTYDWYPIERGASKPMRPMDSYSRSSTSMSKTCRTSIYCVKHGSSRDQENTYCRCFSTVGRVRPKVHIEFIKKLPTALLHRLALGFPIHSVCLDPGLVLLLIKVQVWQTQWLMRPQ